MTDVSLSPDVVVIDGVLRVSSLEIAERFCKQHSHVLEGIRKISLECEEDFNESNFRLVEYADAKGEMRPMYQLSRDGFTLLAMGFAGKKALEWKIKYIQAFNAMEEALTKKREKLALKEAKKKALPKTTQVALPRKSYEEECREASAELSEANRQFTSVLRKVGDTVGTYFNESNSKEIDSLGMNVGIAINFFKIAIEANTEAMQALVFSCIETKKLVVK